MKKILSLGLLLGWSVGFPTHAQTITQSFNLQAGWNSIWFEVTPTNNDVQAVFDALPLESVWTFHRRLSAVDYIQNVNEPLWNRDQWLVHVPPPRIESINNNLFAAFGQRAYLVKLTVAATLNITGRPVLRPVPWAPDAYNLRGYPIDPTAPPTFNNFFKHSPAHFSAVSNRLERIYKLNATGSWVLAGPGELMQRGVAYWTYCRGNSDYQAPLAVSVGGLEGLEYGKIIPELSVTLNNPSSSNATVLLRDLTNPTPLSYGDINTATGTQWRDLPASFSTNVSAGSKAVMRLAPRRTSLPTDVYASLVEVRNGTGTRWFVPLNVERKPATAAAGRYAGLWVGNISISAVSQAHNPTNSTAPTPAAGDFPLRVLIHVDNGGTTRLLREVIQLRQPPVRTNNAEGLSVLATPERFILVTDERAIPALTGSVLRDGELVGRRISTAGFDFPTTPDANFLRLSGTFGGANTVSGSFTIPPTFARNPFLHRYHPDHDNLNETFNGFREEAFNITRAFELQFSPVNLVGATTTEYGYNTLSGTYRETVVGLNRKEIAARGVFRLTRVSEVATLNP